MSGDKGVQRPSKAASILASRLLCGAQLMLQATVCDGLAFDPFAFEEDGLGASEVDLSRSEIAEALVIAGMVVVLDEGRDRAIAESW